MIMMTETSQASDKGGAAFLILLKQLWRNVEKLPGWIPLVFFYHIAVTRAPENETYLGIPIRPYLELFVGVLAFLSYQVGDAIDKPFFKNFEGSWLDKSLRYVRRPREELKRVLGVREGVYPVAISLLTAGGKYDGSFVHFFNETAKLLRSASLPLLFLPLLPVFVPAISLRWRIVLAILCFATYIFMKPFHMRLLYSRTYRMLAINSSDGTPKEPKYACRDLDDKIRLFFWDGRLVASAEASGNATPCSATS
jgi:hypothetical protein